MRRGGRKNDYKAQTEGGEAYKNGLDEKDNPYEAGTASFFSWQRGWKNWASKNPDNVRRKLALELRMIIEKEKK